MSKAYDIGFDAGIETCGPLKEKHWHSEAYAEGFIAGLEALIQNAYDTPDSDFDSWGGNREETVAEYEGYIAQTKKLMDQVLGGKDHKNTIQAMAFEIEELRQRLAQYED